MSAPEVHTLAGGGWNIGGAAYRRRSRMRGSLAFQAGTAENLRLIDSDERKN